MADPKPTNVNSDVINPTTGLILTFVTCGFYELFVWWPARFRAINAMLGREEMKYGSALIATFLTCGMMYFYFDYKCANAINEIRASKGMEPNKNLPTLTIVLDVFGFAFITSYMHQEDINKLLNA